MKPILALMMLFPFSLIGQDMAMVPDRNVEQVEMSGITMTRDGEINISSVTVPANVNPSAFMMDMDLSEVVIEFHSSAGVSGPAQGSGISNGLNVLAATEGMSASISVGPGSPISSAGPSPIDLSFTRFADINSTQIRSLMISETTIPHIEVFYLKLVNSSYKIFHIIRYEDCQINGINMSHAEGDIPLESVSFSFTRACYRSYSRDVNGNETGQSNTCFDQALVNQSGCACGVF